MFHSFILNLCIEETALAAAVKRRSLHWSGGWGKGPALDQLAPCKKNGVRPVCRWVYPGFSWQVLDGSGGRSKTAIFPLW